MKNIVLISSGQPSLNPRLIKEADTLAENGYQVTVLYAYWNLWGTKHDQDLLSQKKWTAVRLGGDPTRKRITWFISRLIFKVSGILLQKTGKYKYLADVAVARSSFFLIRGAKKYKADLYIAHNIGALPAAVKTAALYHSLSGFDAEDFHRQEVSDDVNSYKFKLFKYIEDKYLPAVNYLTASSPLIAEKYDVLYNKSVTTLLNVFPKTTIPVVIKNDNAPLKLFWFSQTIGPHRGLEMAIKAIGLCEIKPELHLLGQLADGYKQHLLTLAEKTGACIDFIFFYEPIKSDEIFSFSSRFDIGLASDTEICLNRDISLTNKLFCYIQSGLAVAAYGTMAQATFMESEPQIGKVYRSAGELSVIINEYDKNRESLFQTKNESFKLGQNNLNWENESRKFLGIIENVLSGKPENEN